MSAVVMYRGHVVGDGPELRVSDKGVPWVRLRVATKRMVKGADGTLVPPANPVFLEVRAFGEVAEQIAEKARRGAYVEGTGTWEQSRWEGKDGSRHQRDYVVSSMSPHVWPKREEAEGDVDDAWGYGEEPPFEDGEQ